MSLLTRTGFQVQAILSAHQGREVAQLIQQAKIKIYEANRYAGNNSWEDVILLKVEETVYYQTKGNFNSDNSFHSGSYETFRNIRERK